MLYIYNTLKPDTKWRNELVHGSVKVGKGQKRAELEKRVREKMAGLRKSGEVGKVVGWMKGIDEREMMRKSDEYLEKWAESVELWRVSEGEKKRHVESQKAIEEYLI